MWCSRIRIDSSPAVVGCQRVIRTSVPVIISCSKWRVALGGRANSSPHRSQVRPQVKPAAHLRQDLAVGKGYV